MIDRRQVLRLLLSGAAAAAVDPDSALWIPGRKKIFIPPVSVIARPTLADILADGRWHYIVIDQQGRIIVPGLYPTR